MNKSVNVSLFVVLLVAVFSTASVGAQAPLPLVTGEWAPFTSEKMEGYGFCAEIVSLTLAEMGIQPRYEFVPWKRCETMVESAAAWAAFPYSITEERAKKYLFSDPIGSSTTKFFYYNKPAKITYERLEDLKPYTLGGVLGYFYEELFQKAGLKTDYSAGELQSFQKLKVGRIDLVPNNELVGWDLIRQNFPGEADKFGVVDKPLVESELNLIVSKTYPNAQHLLNRFNAALKKVKLSQEYKAVLRKYGLK